MNQNVRTTDTCSFAALTVSNTINGSVTGNAATATLATKTSTLSQGGGNGTGMTFNWSGQSGQPTWLWGSNDGTNIYVWNPSNFNVNSATSATTATTATTVQRLGQWDAGAFNAGSNSLGSGTRANSLNPNTYIKQISFEFKDGNFTTIAGNYSGLITIAPWDSTTVSTGDSSYQMLFSSAAANSTAAPVLRLRAGIDTTWGSWATVVHSANISSYAVTSAVTSAVAGTGVSVSGATGAVTFSIGQGVGTSATVQFGNVGISVAASNRLHINGDATNPAIRVDNGAVVLAASAASNSKTFYGWLPISIAGTTKWIQMYN
jgi:hypothetical protein